MSKEVKRYGAASGHDSVMRNAEWMEEVSGSGGYVSWDDYAALLAERDAAQKDADRYRWLLRQAWFQSAFERYDFEDGGSQRLFELCAAEIIDHALQGDQP